MHVHNQCFWLLRYTLFLKMTQTSYWMFFNKYPSSLKSFFMCTMQQYLVSKTRIWVKKVIWWLNSDWSFNFILDSTIENIYLYYSLTECLKLSKDVHFWELKILLIWVFLNIFLGFMEGRLVLTVKCTTLL